ncbi:glutamate-5-semialdehyde dehydrogenase [Aphanothece hegewaldii CCALA 016]|uniref:Gamma-glutamyl phosphate reductase n=1 Tax=Aphanothece hegewaldii CCALA 016 TaxID=2107694 RepID=A0A2T1LVQ7_9CHRO|nr:glutamate-5-semialdehyde dehydrogenase [Aphanothece hegewaldii]PSF35724.1 glutamate-5-semialdehyde dehydrogenase [Aphanothece hegewaldii CCALA 016]
MSAEIVFDPILTVVKHSYQAFLDLENHTGVERSRAVKAMAKGIQKAFDEILEANTLDLETSREMAVSEQILRWLKLTPLRLEVAVEVLEQLAEAADPILQVTNASYQLNPSQTYCQRMPLGVVALIYEAFPELGAIAAGFTLKTGNSLILRGCGTSSHSSVVIARILHTALEDSGLPVNCVQLIETDDTDGIDRLVNKDQYINLVIPYGRPGLISRVSQLATVPVLRSAMGNCYLYWSPSGDLELTRHVIIDSHTSVPDPVNSIEKVLISSKHNPSLLGRLFNNLKEKGFILKGDIDLVANFPDYLIPTPETEWNKPYLDKVIAFKIVEDLSNAIAWINSHSSGHADCIITESYRESRQFAMNSDSALVYINSSPRFSRNPKQGESVFLGVSNQKGQRRGLISLETFTTLKQVVQG